MGQPSTPELAAFCGTVWDYFSTHRRDLPWRHTEPDDSFDPYKILVSELMLQQTQVPRVVPKFEAFLQTFPTVQALAAVSLGEVLTIWNGLGYNRRAKFVWQSAKMIVDEFDNTFPTDPQGLERLPGVGPNTAGAIMAYAYDQPAVFIETNIRTVFIHHFFSGQADVSDKAILEILVRTLGGQAPREWYWALMDYGAHLKATVGNVSRASKSYARQSAFQGSQRQLRGQVIRLLTHRAYKRTELVELVADDRLNDVLHDLEREQLIQKVDAMYKVF